MIQMSRFCLLILTGILFLGLFDACGTSQPTASAPTSAPATVAIAEATSVPPTSSGTDATSVPTSASANPTAAATSAPTSNNDATAIKKINLNTATAEEILSIPNTGNRMVREFQEYRPYTSILQFRREIGKYVDAQTVAEYEKYVYVPIDVNAADAETLQQIPGLDANEAAALIAARPFASHDAFLKALSQYISADELALAQTYLVSP